MSYYKPSFSQTAAMTRGRGYSPRGYRGSGRGSSWGGRGYGPRGGGNRSFDSFSGSFDSRSKYGGSGDRYSGSRGHGGHDDFRKHSYRMDSGYSPRDSGHRSPDRKRPRNEAPSSRHDSSYGGYGSGASGRYDSSYSDRRSFSSDRHPAPFTRRDEFRRPSGPPRGGYRGRISSRGSRGLKLRDRPPRRRLIESSYAVRKRIIPSRTSDYARRLKISKMRSAIAARKKRASDKEDSDEEKEDKDEEMKEEEEEDEEKKENNEGEDEEGTAKKTEEGSDKEDKGEATEEPPLRKTFIKLNCPHCGIKAVTFRKYEIHLHAKTHMMAMRKIAIKQKSILAQMRMAQRNAQNELEKTSNDLAPRTNFCPLCKLNYKQRKTVHQESEAHKNMKKFLMPYCKLCSITFKSPMMYESHCCSIEHLKRKQRVEDGENSDEFDEETNLENFTTIDSVGVDGDASEDDDKKDHKEPVSVGIEQIRKVEAYYCDLCKMYVGRGNDETIPSILARHCKQRTHMQRYIRYKEDKDLEKRAEKLQRKETAEKEGKEKQTKEGADESASPKKNAPAKDEKDDDATNKAMDDEEARDDKLWADVDKDLDDILAKEEGAKSSDEDEDVNGERYDRFKYSEKNGDEKEGEEGAAVADGVKANEVAVEK